MTTSTRAPSNRRKGINPRSLRLISGLVLFVYVAMHLSNHALGNVSVEAMEAGLVGMKWIWQSLPGAIVLYTALLLHVTLAYRALYERRVFRFGRIEVPQLLLGLLIPLILVNHVTVTRIAFALSGFSKGYAQELYSFWVASTDLGILQVVLLLVAWAHGCIGMYFWLRLKPWFRLVALPLFGAAVLLPVLALLGFYQGGRIVLELAKQREWLDIHATAIETGTIAEKARLADIRNILLSIYLGGVVSIFIARAWRGMRERSQGLVRLTYPERRTIEVPRGLSLLDASTRYEIPHASVCGGRGRCGTCLVTVLAGRENCPPPGIVEAEMLDRMKIGPHSAARLGCQLRPTGDVTFVPMLPPGAGTDFAFGNRRKPRPGRSRVVVCMAVELRDIAAFETDEATLDLVFVTNRFLGTVAQSVTEAGGQPNHFYGNGMLALFGLESEPATAARQALEAAAMTSVSLDHLNALLAPDLPRKLELVVALHVGPAVLGEVGVRDELAFSAIGGTVRDTESLLAVARLSACEVLVSEALCEVAGLAAGVLQRYEVELPGERRSMEIRLATEAVQIFGALDSIVDDATRTDEPPGHAKLLPV